MLVVVVWVVARGGRGTHQQVLWLVGGGGGLGRRWRSLDTEGKRGNIEEEKILSLLRGVTRKDGSLDSSTIGNSLIRVDALVGLCQGNLQRGDGDSRERGQSIKTK